MPSHTSTRPLGEDERKMHSSDTVSILVDFLRAHTPAGTKPSIRSMKSADRYTKSSYTKVSEVYSNAPQPISAFSSRRALEFAGEKFIHRQNTRHFL